MNYREKDINMKERRRNNDEDLDHTVLSADVGMAASASTAAGEGTIIVIAATNDNDDTTNQTSSYHHNNNNDVILGLNNEYYKQIMFHHYRLLGKERGGEKETQVGKEILDIFKTRMARTDGMFFKCKRGGYGLVPGGVNDEVALVKIMADIKKRMESHDRWSSSTSIIHESERDCNLNLVQGAQDGDAASADASTEKKIASISMDNVLEDVVNDETGLGVGEKEESEVASLANNGGNNDDTLEKGDSKVVADNEQKPRSEVENHFGGDTRREGDTIGATRTDNGTDICMTNDASLNDDSNHGDGEEQPTVASDAVVDGSDMKKSNENQEMMGNEERAAAAVEIYKEADEKKEKDATAALAPSLSPVVVIGDHRSMDNSSMNNGELFMTTSPEQHHPRQKQQQKQEVILPRCSSLSFNETLKAALNCYHKSNTLVKSANEPAKPVVPPFLSHEEECTLKTALAFVIVKAKYNGNTNKGKRTEDISRMNRPLFGRSAGTANLESSSIIMARRGGVGGAAGSMPADSRLQNPSRLPAQIMGGRSCLLGGLLSLPPTSRRVVAPVTNTSTTNNSNGNILALDRKLKHVRDVLNLAVSAVLPLYRGALEVKGGNKECDASVIGSTSPSHAESMDDDVTVLEGSDAEVMKKNDKAATGGRSPCAVYDYEAAVQPSTGTNSMSSSFPRSLNGTEHNQLDGLCQHVIMRLSALIREEELKSRNRFGRRGRASSCNSAAGGGNNEENDENNSNANGSPTVVTDKSRETTDTIHGQRRTNTKTRQEPQGNSKCIVRDAITRLIYNDLIGDAYLSKKGGGTLIRECADEHRIEKIMAVCHVLHRLLFLDKGCCLGTEFVLVICSILSDLYSNEYCGTRRSMTNGEQDHDQDGESEPNDNGSSNSIGQSHNKQSKEKYQVVSSRWGESSSSYSSSASNIIHDRHERRRQAVDILSQRQRRWGNLNNASSHSGAKRRHWNGQAERTHTTEKNFLPPPRIGDVMAVNLLRLLEGAAAIRLHHRRQRVPSLSSRHHPASQKDRREYMLDKAASAAATEVLNEIRSTVEHELILPLHVENAATFCCNEKMHHSQAGEKAVLLQPGGKMMLRLHLFELMNKLSLYEQV